MNWFRGGAGSPVGASSRTRLWLAGEELDLRAGAVGVAVQLVEQLDASGPVAQRVR